MRINKFYFLLLLLFVACNNSPQTDKTENRIDSLPQNEVPPKTSTNEVIKNETDENSIPKVDISNVQNTTEIKLSDLGQVDIQYIPLETKASSLFVETFNTKLQFGKDAYYINGNNKLLKFSLNGNFEREIGLRGNGPNEYHSLMDYSIDNVNNWVCVLCYINHKIYVYDTSGNFVKAFDCPEKTTKIICNEGKILCGIENLGDSEYSFILIDYDGQIIDKYPNKNKYKIGKIPNFTDEFFYYSRDDKLFIKETHSDTIFSFEDSQLKPYLILNRGNKRFPTELRISNSMEQGYNNMLESFKYICEKTVLETDSYIYSNFTYNGEDHCYLVSKNGSNPFFKVSASGIINDIDGGPNIWVKASKDENNLFSWIEAYELIEYVNSTEFQNSTPQYPEKKAELEELANSLDENDNPVLMFVKLKE